MDASLIRWQRGMSALFKDIVDTTPAGEIADSSLEFKFDGDDRRYMRSAACTRCSLITCASSDGLHSIEVSAGTSVVGATQTLLQK